MILHGKVHGKIIELTENPGLADGQQVVMTVQSIPPAGQRQPGEGFLRTEGALADDPYWDDIMEEIYQERHRDTRKEIEE